MPGGVLGKSLMEVCRWDSETLNLYQTTFMSFLQPYSRLDAKIPTLSQTSYFRANHQKYNHTVLLMENHLSINNIVTISFIFSISEFFKPIN